MSVSIINHPEIRDFCAKIKMFDLANKAKVCGVDIAEGFIRFKVYVELLDIPDVNTTKAFLGDVGATQFYEHVKFWDKNRESGLAFGIKVDTNNTIRRYFHIKFKEDYQELMYDNQLFFLKLFKINSKLLLKGISYEIESDESYFNKFYLYVKDKQSIEKIVRYKNLKCNPTHIDELEIYATKHNYKINIINSTGPRSINSNVWDNVPAHLHSSITDFSSALISKPMYSGCTREGLYSVYYSLTFQEHNVLGI